MKVDYMKNVKTKKRPKPKKVPVFQQMIDSLNLDMQNAHLINIKNKYE